MRFLRDWFRGPDPPPAERRSASQSAGTGQEELIVLLEEYRDLRGEIARRVNNQLVVLGGMIVLVATLLPVVGREGYTDALILGAPFVFGTTAWIYFEQHIFVAQAAAYVHQRLRPAILARVDNGQDLLAWESFRNDVLYGRRINRMFLHTMTVFQLVATLGPGLFIILAALTVQPWRDESGAVETWRIVIFVLGCSILPVLLFQAMRSKHLYREIAEPR
jgi:hypothetical protein